MHRAGACGGVVRAAGERAARALPGSQGSDAGDPLRREFPDELRKTWRATHELPSLRSQVDGRASQYGRTSRFLKIARVAAFRQSRVPMSSSTTWLASECDAPLHAQSDEALMELVQSNHHDAMGVLFSRYRRLVQNIAWRILRDNEEAEDLVQSVFLEMFQSAFLFDPAKGKAKVWMLQYAYHRAFSRKEYLRGRGLYSPRPQFCHEPAGKSETNFLLALESAQFV